MYKINELPELTWRWVQANDAQTKIPYSFGKEFTQYEDRKPEGLGLDEYFNIKYGLSEDVLKLNDKYRNWTNSTLVEEGQEIEEKYSIFLKDGENELNDLQEIHLKEGSKATLIYDYKSEKGIETIRNSIFRIRAEKNSYLKLVLVQKFADEGFSMASIVSSVDSGAKVELVQVDLGAMETYSNYQCDLLAPQAESQIHAAYFVDQTRIHDVNYHIHHRGEFTNSDMQINGALKDTARKRFVGTLDFKKGSGGSVGNEEEFVTLIDEEVRSIALPLLLAAEHDIMGNHAASAGRIDQDMLIYLMSRGLNEKEAKALAVEAKMTPTVDLIPDQEMKDEVKKFIHGGITE